MRDDNRGEGIGTKEKPASSRFGSQVTAMPLPKVMQGCGKRRHCVGALGRVSRYRHRRKLAASLLDSIEAIEAIEDTFDFSEAVQPNQQRMADCLHCIAVKFSRTVLTVDDESLVAAIAFGFSLPQ